ncbi:unnamed protein product [Malus baccata var. baccata]
MRPKTNENDLKTLSFNDKDKIKGKVNSTMIDFLVISRGWVRNSRKTKQKRAVVQYFFLMWWVSFPLEINKVHFLSSYNQLEIKVFKIFQYFFRKINEKSLKILSFNDKGKIKGKVNSTRIDFLM